MLLCVVFSIPKNQKRAVNRRASQKKSSGPSQAELMNTATTIVGRMQIASVSSDVTGFLPTATLNLDPATVGDRLTIASTIFERYRIKSIRLTFKSSAPSNYGGRLTMGVQDDASSGTVPKATDDEILNLRCSNTELIHKDQTVVFTPVDPKKWYYCSSDGAPTDRFTVQAALNYGNNQTPFSLSNINSNVFDTVSVTSTVLGRIIMEYVYVFQGNVTL